MFSDSALKAAYRKYNRLYFNNELPDDTDLYFSPEGDCYGSVQEDEGGAWLLQINTKFLADHRMWKLTLLHEMAHLKLRPYVTHGEPFQREMQRLAKLGAFKGLW